MHASKQLISFTFKGLEGFSLILFFFFAVPAWRFWTFMTNARWLIPLSLVRWSHIIFPPYGNPSTPSLGKYDSFSTPPCTSLPTVASAKQKQSLVRISPLGWHVCNASSAICCGCWFHRGFRCLSQYMRSKHFSYWSDSLPFTLVSASTPEDTDRYQGLFCDRFDWKSQQRHHFRSSISTSLWWDDNKYSEILYWPVKKLSLHSLGGCILYGVMCGEYSLATELFGAAKSSRVKERYETQVTFW